MSHLILMFYAVVYFEYCMLCSFNVFYNQNHWAAVMCESMLKSIFSSVLGQRQLIFVMLSTFYKYWARVSFHGTSAISFGYLANYHRNLTSQYYQYRNFRMYEHILIWAKFHHLYSKLVNGKRITVPSKLIAPYLFCILTLAVTVIAVDDSVIIPRST